MEKPIKVAHLADIHIRNTSRHVEYAHVFENLYQSLVEQSPNLIVVVGDIFHQKQVTSPESTQMTMDFLGRLREIAPLLITIGNHDLSESAKKTRVDAITPIYNYLIKTGGTHPVWYMKESGTFEFENMLDFYHYSFLDNNELEIINNGNYKVGLYHGVVSGSRTEGGYYFEDKHESRIVPFSKFDCSMIGDIHKYQVLSHNVVYPSSLICQNYGEHPTEHGYVLWTFEPDTRKINHELIRIHNDYTLFTVVVDEAKTLHLLDYEIDKYTNPSVRVFYHPTVSLNSVKEIIANETDIKTAVYRKGDDEKTTQGVEKSKQQEIINLYDYETLEANVREYLSDKVSDDDLKQLMVINKELFVKNSTKFESKSDKKPFDLSQLSFSDTFCYGSGNVVDFERLNGVVGLFARNRTGKSSMLNTIPYSIFGTFPRMGKLANVYNNNSDTYETQSVLESGDGKYRITRRGKRTKKTQQSSLIFEQWDNGDWINLSEDSAVTNEKIKQVFGDLDSYLKTAYIYQNSTDLFLNLKPSERKDWISSNLGLEIFEILHESAKVQSEDIRYKFKYLSGLGLYDKLQELMESKNFYETTVNAFKQNLGKVQIEKNEIESKIEIEKSKLKTVGIIDESISEGLLNQWELENQLLSNKITELKTQIERVQQSELEHEEYMELVRKSNLSRDIIAEKIKEKFNVEIDGIRKTLDEKRTRGNLLKEEAKQWVDERNLITKTDVSLLTQLESKLLNEEHDIKSTKSELLSVLREIDTLKATTSILDNDKRFLTEELCKSCPLLKNAHNAHKTLVVLNEKVENLNKTLLEKQAIVTDTQTQVDSYRELVKSNELYDSLTTKIANNRSDMLLLKSEIELGEEKIKTIESKIESEIDGFISKINTKKLELESEFKDKKNKDIQAFYTQIETVNGMISTKKEEIQKSKQILVENEKIREVIKQNLEIQLVIDKLKTDLSLVQVKWTEGVEEFNKAEKQVFFFENSILDVKKQIEELKTVEEQFNLYQHYITATHRDAIPLNIIRKVLGTLEFYVNEVLAQVADFTLNLYIENDNIEANMTSPERGTWTSDLLSGMETFMVNLSFRIGIQKIANLNIPSFLIIDEGFSALDSENAQRIPELFEYLRSIYKFVIVVSHNDYMHDFTDYTIEINRVEEKSYISC